MLVELVDGLTDSSRDPLFDQDDELDSEVVSDDEEVTEAVNEFEADDVRVREL